MSTSKNSSKTASKIPAKIKAVLRAIARGEIIPALPLLELPSVEYQCILKKLKLAGYEYHVGSGQYYKESRAR